MRYIAIILLSNLWGQTWIDYLRSPVKWTVRLTNGYDNNVLRLSPIEKDNAALNQTILGEKYLLVRFEDLIANPEREMKKVSAFLNIEFSDNFLKQTIGNKKQGAVSSIERGMRSGIKDISGSRLEQFFKHTSKTERRILGLFTWDLAKHFDYNIDPVEELTASDMMIPLKYERPEDYLSNRLYMLSGLRRKKSSLLKNVHFKNIMNDFRRGEQVAD